MVGYTDDLFSEGKSISEINRELLRNHKNEIIGFFMITKNKKIIHHGHYNKPIELEIIKHRVNENGLVKFNTALYTLKKYKNGINLYVGVHFDEKILYYERMEKFFWHFVFEVPFVFLLTFIFIELLVKFVIQTLLLKFHKSSHPNPLMDFFMSKEMVVLSDGIDGFHEDYKNLKESYKLVEEQIPEAIRVALSEKRTNFEDIKCAMVSTDINRSSTIQDRFPKDVYIPIFQEVMNTITDTVKAYGGNSYKFMGDEIIYYFSETNRGNAIMLAVSAVKDINSKLYKLNEKYKKANVGFDVTTKSSMTYGTITFTLVNSIFEIMGGCITETIRILSLVEDKTTNSLYVNNNVLKRCDDIVHFDTVGDFKLKGIELERTIYSYKCHKKIENLLENLNVENAKQLTYYRTAEDIVKMIKVLKNNILSLDEKIIFSVLKNWSTFPSVNRDEQFTNEVLDFLDFLDGIVSEKEDVKRVRFYHSYAISLVNNLITPQMFTTRVAELLSKFTTNDYSQRVVANAVEALGIYNLEDNDELIIKFIKHGNNRVISNAIIIQGLEDFDKKTFKALKKLLRRKEKLYIASGIYAAKIILLYHKKNKRVYNVNSYFSKLIKELYRHVKDDNEIIKRQLTIASLELDDEHLRPTLNKKAT